MLVEAGAQLFGFCQACVIFNTTRSGMKSGVAGGGSAVADGVTVGWLADFVNIPALSAAIPQNCDAEIYDPFL